MRRRLFFAVLVVLAGVATVGAQGFDAEPVFRVRVLPDTEPVVAGEILRLAAIVEIETGWHINSNSPGDDFSLPTEVAFNLPEGWLDPIVSFPAAESIEFDFSDTPIQVWEGEIVILANVTVPSEATGDHRLRVTVTAQACNNTQCLPPEDVSAGVDVKIAAQGTSSKPVNQKLFAESAVSASRDGSSDGASDLDSKSLPLLLIGVFFAGLALNLTPCVFPLIPITIGYFTQQTKEREGSTFPLALAYVVGIAITYSILGVLAALSGAIFGSALQSPWVVGVIVAVLLALAASMFGLWELRVPGWAQRASGGRTGFFGALIMGLVMGFVAAPCIGPFVVGLLTYVGQRGDPILGFALFFTLALGLGLPYLILGTFTGAVNKLPASGMWMIGVRKVFGVILIAMAAYFAAPLMPGESGGWLMSAVLVFGALYILVLDRTGHEQPTIDRVMRLLAAIMLVIGVLMAPDLSRGGAEGPDGDGHLKWEAYDKAAVASARSGDRPVIIDFYADWCAPCKELDEKTFSAPEVRAVLEGYERFKVDLTRATEENQTLTRDFSVMGVPTVVVFSGGEEIFRITGFEPAERFLQRLQAVP